MWNRSSCADRNEKRHAQAVGPTSPWEEVQQMEKTEQTEQTEETTETNLSETEEALLADFGVLVAAEYYT
jgi:hypothetical protein